MLTVENNLESGTFTLEVARWRLIGLIGHFFNKTVVASCGAEGGAFVASFGIAITDPFASNDRHKNTIFTDFTENFNTPCPEWFFSLLLLYYFHVARYQINKLVLHGRKTLLKNGWAM